MTVKLYYDGRSHALMMHLVCEGMGATFAQGLYNPFTLSGTILVDGVLASVHSEWFLDNAWGEALGLTPFLPTDVTRQALYIAPQSPSTPSC